jgi:hypothetical protein
VTFVTKTYHKKNRKNRKNRKMIHIAPQVPAVPPRTLKAKTETARVVIGTTLTRIQHLHLMNVCASTAAKKARSTRLNISFNTHAVVNSFVLIAFIKTKE